MTNNKKIKPRLNNSNIIVLKINNKKNKANIK